VGSGYTRTKAKILDDWLVYSCKTSDGGRDFGVFHTIYHAESTRVIV